MAKKELIIIADYTRALTFEELCEISQVPAELISDLVAFEILHPRGRAPADWQFEVNELKRLKRAMRLRRDLEMNLTAVSVVLDLLDEMDTLRTRLNLFERHFSKL